MSTHDSIISCRDAVFDSLVDAMGHRGDGMDWVENERYVVASKANEWAAAHGYKRRASVGLVESIEHRAMGHVDYASKLSLYVAEHIVAEGTEAL